MSDQTNNNLRDIYRLIPGDIAWRLTKDHETLKITCTGCSGSKKIRLQDDSTHECPKCKGSGTVNSGTYESWFVKGPGIIAESRPVLSISFDGVQRRYTFKSLSSINKFRKEDKEVTGFLSGIDENGKPLDFTKPIALTDSSVNDIELHSTFLEATAAAEALTKMSLEALNTENEEKMAEEKNASKVQTLMTVL